MHTLVINIITQSLIIVVSRKNDTAKKQIIIGQKSGPTKNIFNQKSGTAMAGPAVVPMTALVVEGLYYPYSENKGADQLHSYYAADLRLCFRICKNPVFS